MKIKYIITLSALIVSICAVFANSVPTEPYTPEQCEKGNFDGIDITDLWWKFRDVPVDSKEYENIFALLAPYRFMHDVEYSNGIAFRKASVAYSVRDRFLFDMMFAGWYQGDDGFPHPSCGVYLVPK